MVGWSARGVEPMRTPSLRSIVLTGAWGWGRIG